MADRKSHPKQSFEELMRAAGPQRRAAAQRALEGERINRNRGGHGRNDLLVRLELEIASLEDRLAFTQEQEERIMLKAEIAYLRRALEAKRGGGRRKPPESGLAVPAVPPGGPRPQQGGAAAPLDFDS